MVLHLSVCTLYVEYDQCQMRFPTALEQEDIPSSSHTDEIAL